MILAALIAWGCSVGGFVPCGWIYDDDVVVSVKTSDGKAHSFLVDSGCDRSYLDPHLAVGQSLAQSLALELGDGRELPFSASGSSRDEVFKSSGGFKGSAGKKIEGVIGMDVLSQVQLKLDMAVGRVWVRFSPDKMPLSMATDELGVGQPLIVLPLRPMPDGGLAFEASVAGKAMDLEIDTGSNLLALPRADAGHKMRASDVLLFSGSAKRDWYIAKDVSMQDIRLLWPSYIASTDEPSTDGYGFIGPQVFPHRVMIIDFSGQALFTLRPTTEEQIDQALSSFLGGPVEVKNGSLFLIGANSRVTLVAGRPAGSLVADMGAWQRGDYDAWGRLIRFYREFCGKPRLGVVDSAGVKGEVVAPMFSGPGSRPPESGPGSAPPRVAAPGMHWRWVSFKGWVEVSN